MYLFVKPLNEQGGIWTVIIVHLQYKRLGLDVLASSDNIASAAVAINTEAVCMA